MRWFVLLVACSSCIDVFVEPFVADYGDTPTWTPQGQPKLDLGFYVEQLYAGLNDGDALHVIYGTQGGRWTMPAVRLTGLPLEVSLECSVTTSTGEVLGTLSGAQRFVVAPDGWAEMQAIAIPIQHAAPNEALPIDDLFGKEATLRCVATGPDSSATRALRLVVVQG